MDDLKFTSTHEWLKEEQDLVVVGITEHAQELLGDLVFIELPELGKTVQAGEELGVLESVKAAADFYAPVSGVVVSVNLPVVENPATVNTQPYQEGWLVKLKPSQPSELDQLLNAAQYQEQISKE